MKRTVFFTLLLLAMGSASAQEYRATHQTSAAMNPQERANLQLVHRWWHDIMQGRNLNIASHYMPAFFVSRNPNVAAGREAFLQTLRSRPDLLQNYGKSEPEVEFAAGDYVFLMWANFIHDPTEPAHIFKYNTMDLLRIDNGKIVEHWDGAHKVVDTDFGEKGMGGGVYHSSMNLSPQEKETLRLGKVEFKDILQYGHAELATQVMAPGYIQHNPNVPGGRDNFVQFFSGRESKPLSDDWVTPPTLELVSGDFYLKFDQRMEKDPGNADHMTAYYRFDMVRVDDGFIQEHWDVAFPRDLQQ